ncbi:MAG: DUF126 domain-containing protein [Oscillospiraceae bacterium]|nr:DUF126 domain-containing protein [Oscillospiraceae bacterium]
MKKTFQGRVVTAGTAKAEALVSHGGFNTLASFQTPMLLGDKKVRCSDQNNPDLYQKSMLGKALCLPETIGSTTGGMALYTVCATGKQPACLLFSKHIDSLAAAGAILAAYWTDANMPVVDKLGDEFLNTVKDGMTVEIKEDGIVEISDE